VGRAILKDAVQVIEEQPVLPVKIQVLLLPRGAAQDGDDGGDAEDAGRGDQEQQGGG